MPGIEASTDACQDLYPTGSDNGASKVQRAAALRISTRPGPTDFAVTGRYALASRIRLNPMRVDLTLIADVVAMRSRAVGGLQWVLRGQPERNQP
jgi:hypothetical protein